MKTVYKPWGKEEWLELNDKYCYKRIYINAGTKTSYQYHLDKLETNYIIKGKAEVWLENNAGVVEKSVMIEGDFFTVEPPKKHRVIAITDIILQEVSTPEVDDVIRIEDDSNRTSGKLDHEHMRPVLCIVAAGKGSRMGEYGNHVNKGLLPINNKAIISDIIDKTPKEFEIVMGLGYKADQVIEYCEAAHPDRIFKFVKVENFEGDGTGPGATLLECKEYLQRPFYWVTADCLIKDELPALDCNWLGMHPTSIPEIYSSGEVTDDLKITNFTNKKSIFNPIGYKDKNNHGYGHAFIGLCSILDFQLFWDELEANIGDSGEIVSAFYNIKKYDAKAKILHWYDVGTIENYINAQEIHQGKIFGIPKTSGQFLYKVGNRCVKIFQNSVSNKIHRAKNLKEYVPKLVYEGKKTIAYDWIDGKTLYENDNIDDSISFLNWVGRVIAKNKADVNITQDCFKFYRDKTFRRLNQFLDSKDSSFKKGFVINDKKCQPILEYLEKIDWDELCNAAIALKMFHGDMQFDNIIKTKTSYKYIDWRDSFGDNIDYGDAYYDLAKLYGGICMNYSLMKNQENFQLTKFNNDIKYSYKSNPNEEKLVDVFKNKLCKSQDFNFNKIQKLTSLIYLNMSPLHEKEFGEILFFKSLEMLDKYYD